MNIITPGDPSRLLKIKRFECEACGCVFEADQSEYKYSGSQFNGDSWSHQCPCYGKMVYTFQ